MNRREFLKNLFTLSSVGAVQLSLARTVPGADMFLAGPEEQVKRGSFRGLSLPLLGLGLMNLPRTGNDPASIDVATSKRMLRTAMERGVNFFETAPHYHNGAADRLIGTLLKEQRRESCFLASKLSLNRIYSARDAEKELDSQLRRCGTSYFDFCALRALDSAGFARAEKYHLPELFRKWKKRGKIRFSGFSFSDTPEVLDLVLSAAEWDFAQIALNYADWEFCRGKELYQCLERHGVPIIAADALRGGDLQTKSRKNAEFFRNGFIDDAAAVSAWRFPASLPGVFLTLSHAASNEQLTAAIRPFRPFRKLSEGEQRKLIETANLRRAAGALNPCGNCLCSRQNPFIDSRTVSLCPFSIHPKNRRFHLL